MKRLFRGFTLTELLIVVTLIAIMVLLAMVNWQRQIIRGYDAKRKTDLSKIRQVFEDYYNDKNCYPSKDDWDTYNCATQTGADVIQKYIKPIPCDPQTNIKYLYLPLPIGGTQDCSGYHLLAALGNTSDLDIIGSGCDPDPNKGCGFEPYSYNYGISVGAPVANPEFDFQAPVATPTTSQFPPGNWICPAKGQGELQNCQYYSESCRDLMIERGCATYASGNDCSALCNPSQQNACDYLSECNL